MRRLTLPVFLLISLSSYAQMIPLIQSDPLERKPLAIIETPEHEIRMEHIDKAYHHYVFDVEIFNNTDSVVGFDPAKILYYASDRRFETVDNQLHTKAAENSMMNPVMFYATDSSDVIELATRSERNARIMRGVAVGLAVVAVAAHTSNNYNAFKKSEWNLNDARRYRARQGLAITSYFAGRVVNDVAWRQGYRSSEDIQYLPAELMPAGALQPGESRRGKVFLKQSSYQLKYWRIIVPVGNREYVFDFKSKNAKGIVEPDTDKPFVDR